MTPSVLETPENPATFRENSRQRSWMLPAQAFVPGNRMSFLLPQSGYLGPIYVRVFGSIRRSVGDTSTSIATAGDIFQRLQLAINIGAGFPVDITGKHMHFLQFMLQRGTHPFSTRPTVFSPFLFPIPLAGPPVDTPFVWQWIIPVNQNDGINFEDGLINLQALEVQASLNINCGVIADIFPTGSVLTGTSFQNVFVEIGLETYEVPRPGTNTMIPAFLLHRLVSDSQPINSLGDQSYRPLPEGRLLQLHHIFIVNNTQDDGMFTQGVPGAFQLGDMEIWLDQGDRNYQYTRFIKDLQFQNDTGNEPINGFKVWDFANAYQFAGAATDARDTYDLTRIAVFESRMKVSGTLGAAGTNRIDTMRRLLQPLKT